MDETFYIRGRSHFTLFYILYFQARTWMLVYGFTLAFGSMFSKTWRVHVLFTNKKLTRKVDMYKNPNAIFSFFYETPYVQLFLNYILFTNHVNNQGTLHVLLIVYFYFVIAVAFPIANWSKCSIIFSDTNPFRPECTIVILIHYKPRIAVAILDL